MFEAVVDELVGLSDDELDARIRTNELERRRLDSELAFAVSIADQRQLYSADGHRSMTAYLRATLNYSTAEASKIRSLGRAVDHVDGLGAAWAAGRFGRPQALEFARVHGNPRVRDQLGTAAPLLLRHAEELPHRDFVECIEHFVRQADTDGAHDDRDEQIEHRDAHVSDVGGTLKIDAHGGDPLAAAELIAIFERFVDAEFAADVAARRAEHGDDAEAHELPRTSKQRRHDALVTIFRAAASAVPGATTTHNPLVNIVIDADTWARLLTDSGLASTTDLTGRPINPFTGSTDPRDLLDDLTHDPNSRCETADGQSLHPHDVLRAALAGHVRRVVVDSKGTVIDHGRKTRMFTGSAREAARLLVKRCEHPGCGLLAEWCDVDHAVEWTHGGTTDQTNASVRCGAHNRQKHRKRWRSSRADNSRTYTIRSDGTIMLPVGVRPPTLPDRQDSETIDPSNVDLGAIDPDTDEPIEIACLTAHIRRRLRNAHAA